MWSPARKVNTFWHSPGEKKVSSPTKILQQQEASVTMTRESKSPQLLDVEASVAVKLNGEKKIDYKKENRSEEKRRGLPGCKEIDRRTQIKEGWKPMWSPARKANTFWHSPDVKPLPSPLKKVSSPIKILQQQESSATMTQELKSPEVLDVEASLAVKLNGKRKFDYKKENSSNEKRRRLLGSKANDRRAIQMKAGCKPIWSPARKANSFWHSPERTTVESSPNKVSSPTKTVEQEPSATRTGKSETPQVLTDTDVEALLALKLKERCEMMGDYIKKLRACLRLYREAETQFLFEKEDSSQQLHMEAVARQKLEETYLFRIDEHDAEMADIKCRFEDSENELRDARSQNEGLLVTLEMSQSSLEDEKQKVVLLEEGLAKAKKENGDLSQQLSSLMDVNKRLQEQNRSLQQYNSKLQSDAVSAGESTARLSKEKDVIIESLTTVRGNFAVVQDQLVSSKNLLADKVKANKELENEGERLKSEILRLTKEKDLYSSHIDRLSEENLKIKESKVMLEKEFEQLSVKANAMEEAYNAHIYSLSSVRSQLDFTQQRLKELKGNVRVLCRVRPSVAEEEVGATSLSAVHYPSSAELAGRGVELVQSQGLEHSFVFDEVFGPDVRQDDVFVEVSQLVQKTLDGYKVYIFAYGQTGSGKTHTMLGNDRPDLRGIIPRSLEQIFKTSQELSCTGWMYKLKGSMLEIYNDSIRVLVARPGHGDDKQHVLQHAAQGNTIVTDLTIVDVCNWKEVACLHQRATETTSAGKTGMNEVSH